MSIAEISKPCFIAVCDWCGTEFDINEEGVEHFESIEDARQRIEGCDWLMVGDEVACESCAAAVRGEDKHE